MLEVKINKDPYGDKKLFKQSTINLQVGLNVIIGRNGVGKTTFCNELNDFCKNNKIPIFSYNNYSEGSNNAMSKYLFLGDFESLASTAFHSEGEQIFYNFGEQIKKLGNFVRSNLDKKKLVVSFDAMDSGLDVEGIGQLLEIIETITNDCKEKDVAIYFVVTANNYALIHKQHCIDIQTGKECVFNNYEIYKRYILKQYEKERSKKS